MAETRVSKTLSRGGRRFAVALSFPGERRDVVAQVADHLAEVFGAGLVLYDRYHEAEFARPDLDVYLPKLYGDQSDLVVVFLCPEYEKKRWCGLEWRYIRQLIATAEARRIMFVSFGDPGDLGQIGILPGDGYLDIGERQPAEIAAKIVERFQINGGAPLAPGSTDVAGGSGRRVDVSRIAHYAPADLIGREEELGLLEGAWAKVRRGETGRTHVVTLVGLGGEGKTSLVAKWLASLAGQGWPDCDGAFAWSFYSQGTRDQMTASSDLFLKEALTFFGDLETAGGPSSAWDKGRRLAELVGGRAALLVLDGLEPLQYAPASSQAGQLKDEGVAALLKRLASSSCGLCVVTTRYPVRDVQSFLGTTVLKRDLMCLSKEAGSALLVSLGVRGTTAELEALVEDVKGHALTLNLLGTYLREAYDGDVRRRDRVKLDKAVEEQGGHAFRVIDAYARWLETEGEKGRRALAVLRMMGLFDRPVTADCLAALMRPPTIPRLTETLAEASEEQLAITRSRLESARLLTVNREVSGGVESLDAHPLIREYFARELRDERPSVWRDGHLRVYEHLCTATKEGPAPNLEDLQPLYQAVTHGCHAGRQQEACEKVYRDRILQGTGSTGFYSSKKLGAFGANLGALACFFEHPWSRVSRALTEVAQPWVVNQAAFHLRALGRLTEALEPARAGLEANVSRQSWGNAAIAGIGLSELGLALGDLVAAERDAQASATHADWSGDLFRQTVARTTLADAYGQAGRWGEAKALFQQAEAVQATWHPEPPLLYSSQGFRYCDLLLAPAERASWVAVSSPPTGKPIVSSGLSLDVARQACSDAAERATATLPIAERNNWLLDIAHDHLTLGRASLYAAILEFSDSQRSAADFHVTAALDGLRRAGQKDYLPRGLLTRALLGFLTGARGGADGAQSDLDEAWEIAERGPMRLHLVDILLHRARLFHNVTPYPWQSSSPRADLATARALIEKCGYWRRKEELEDAEEAARNR